MRERLRVTTAFFSILSKQSFQVQDKNTFITTVITTAWLKQLRYRDSICKPYEQMSSLGFISQQRYNIIIQNKYSDCLTFDNHASALLLVWEDPTNVKILSKLSQMKP